VVTTVEADAGLRHTVDDPEGPNRYDHAGTYPELVAWSVQIGILPPDQAEALLAFAEEHPRARSAALKRAHQLRRCLERYLSQVGEMPGLAQPS
jgi:hypothetical protein